MSESLALFSLPLFPLSTVLYPGGTLPLRIFEVRYLDMIGKCHKTGAPFGVVALTTGAEVRKPDNGSPTGDGFAPEVFHAVGTLASITEFSHPQSGLMMIRCTGMQRFRITHQERLKHGLWVADVSPLANDLTVKIPDDLQGVATALGNLINTLLARALPLAQMPMPMQPPYQLDDCAWVANRWCELLPMPLEHKQRLMELDNPLVRLELVSDLLERSGIAT
ncbi:LON peptidase substrate-binding domain-containing protein [Rhodoferax ferrireducens]|uniref:LON peptidase substrate-binding domain-containing protein n=1 Tax=Rhodoferax ferrireducens TaxID=192843 RepID=UPI00298E3946|nr:LON peptidase substrate-binding domain-containing protein [Rhodoferax ferrireducens]WPC68684.1 LON peptidase substrate-binding domain-containing protein [Rhodoferax ferrireducens]